MKFTRREINEGRTIYSPDFQGSSGNYGWSASVSVTAPGFVRIVQTDEQGKVTDTVLLSPKQWEEIVAFVDAPRRRAVA